MSTPVEFAVTDVETTGFLGSRDRIIEIAIVRTSGDGRVIREYSTLVNPERDVGAFHIHGISAKDVEHAPKFSDIVGDVLDCLRDAAFVAHNASFDWRFVAAEFDRSGYGLPEWPNICTLKLARQSNLPVANCKLGTLCEYFGIAMEGQHRAICDARATVVLLSKLLHRDARFVQDFVRDGLNSRVREVGTTCPLLPRNGKQLSRSAARQIEEQKPTLLKSILDKLPSVSDMGRGVERYVDLLDRVLEDRAVNADEEGRLLELAVDCGLTAAQVMEAHQRFFVELLRVALQDDVLTKIERTDLEYVRRILGINDSDALCLLKTAREAAIQIKSEGTGHISRRPIVGKSVCFTGDMHHELDGEPVTRERAEAIAKSRGMIVRKSVTKKLDYLVVADAATASTKAKKASAYGTRVIAEAVFWQMMN